jgi:hypothetical protein
MEYMGSIVGMVKMLGAQGYVGMHMEKIEYAYKHAYSSLYSVIICKMWFSYIICLVMI